MNINEEIITDGEVPSENKLSLSGADCQDDCDCDCQCSDGDPDSDGGGGWWG